MTYVLYHDLEAPAFIIADYPGSEMGGDLSDIYKKGTRLLTPDEVPPRLTLEKRRKSIPGGFQTANGLIIVNGQVHDILERLDPGVHQFLPVELCFKNGDRPEGQYFVINITVKQDSIVAAPPGVDPSDKFIVIRDDAGNFKGLENVGKDWDSLLIRTHKKKVTLQKSALSGVNLWREKRVSGLELFVSDAFFDAMKEQGLKFYKNFRAKEV